MRLEGEGSRGGGGEGGIGRKGGGELGLGTSCPPPLYSHALFISKL